MSGSRPPLPPRSKAASMFMAAPVVFASILMLAIAMLAFLAWRGGHASGERVEIVLSAECMDEAESIISARVEELGLGEPVQDVSGSQLTLTVTLPGLDNDKNDIPLLLSQRGQLQVLSDDEVLATEENIKSVSLDLDESGMPIVKLIFVPTVHQSLVTYIDQKPRESLIIRIDGTDEIKRPNSAKLGDEMSLVSVAGDTRAQMKQSADRAIVLQHGPIPCDVVIESVNDSMAQE